ncbi:maleylpyruvate isomerase family mycothiol-dependent enzyme [Amycolatopsis saalfeldensis]|uniref:TIGR03083 family protein n=1 Tax=Amycolatopsis saalfeldensis TaxID=394193 RepID=A0A1H8WEB6_9PSEU|nr:maleylpyruvate isomerase family mycothiol-dependent enzyme [Amycolatopsis saalfeldensis]SEP25909.1 TIGR03083 family protein [Amycolatopsis saalfeldensis]
MDFPSQCAAIVAQTELLQATVEGADLGTTVPSCPEWTLGQLLNHICAGHRWAEETVRTRAENLPPDDELRHLGSTPQAPSWLPDGARALAATLREAGPDARVVTPVPAGPPRAAFYARRFMNETALHRADATLAVGAEFTLDHDVAVDAMEEWLELGSLPVMLDYFPERRALLGEGRTVHLSPTDSGKGWTIDLTGDLLAWHPGAPAEPTVTVEAPVTDLLLISYGRRAGKTALLTGDADFLDFYLSQVSFG